MALRPQHVTPELLNKVTKALGITALDQWYHVWDTSVAQAVGSTRALDKFGGTVGFLKAAYPHHLFDETKLAPRGNQEKDQKFVEVIVRKLFPNTEILTKARKAVGIINPETDAYLEIDFWIPSLKLGIEYQDKHHYEYQWYANRELDHYRKLDDIKKDTMATMGYTLITIGYWWDKSIESLAATIRQHRPDLLQDYDDILAEVIPPERPSSDTEEFPIIPGVDGIMNPFIPSSNFDPTNWYAGEKYDGVRGVFNPTLHKMFSRSGKELSVHLSLLADIPNVLVEGEITAGRGNYNNTAVVSYRSHPDKVNWPMFRYVTFDIPDAELGSYTQRYSTIINELSSRPYVFAQSVYRILLADKAHLKMLVDATIGDYGEGMIVQRDAPYEYGRAKSLAKIKVRRDADALVIHVKEISCTCKLASGVTIDIDFSGDFYPSNLKPGDIVSYYHKGYSLSGQPKQPEIYKVRYDLSWEEIVSEKPTLPSRRSAKEVIGSGSLVSQNTARNKMGHWNKAANARAFFDKFALTKGFDPLVTDNWYLVTTRSVQQTPGGAGLFYANSFNLSKALSRAYPELKFDAQKFRTRDKTIGGSKVKYGHWNKYTNVRAFFDEFAKNAGFDPLVPENWYPVKIVTLQTAGGGGLLWAYDFSISKALSCAYPELKFEDKFRTKDKIIAARTKIQRGHWRKPQNIRKFLDEFARTHDFDPLVAENWYTITGRSLRKAGGAGVLGAHSFNIRKALLCGYPELKLEAAKFRATRSTVRAKNGHWTKSSNVRAFFDEFARKNDFDPLVTENWYPITTRTVQHARGGGLFRTHSFNREKALAFAYPELKFDATKFRTIDATKGTNKMKYGHWNKSSNVRAFFDEFAQTHGFDPLVADNWNSITNNTLRKAGGEGIFSAYKNNIQNALSFAYPELAFEQETLTGDIT